MAGKAYTAADFLSADLSIRSVDCIYTQNLDSWARQHKLPRRSDGLVCYISGKIEYEFGDIRFSAEAGDILRLPNGVPYSGKGVFGPYAFVVIDFMTEDPGAYAAYPLPYVYRPRNPSVLRTQFEALQELWAHPAFCCQMDLKNGILGILSELTKEYAQDVCRYTDKSRILQIADYLRKNYTDPALRVDSIAGFFHISPSQLRRLFAAELGTSPAAMITHLRMERAKNLLYTRSDLSVEQISVMSGFGSVYYFSYAFRRETGMSPTECRGLYRASH